MFENLPWATWARGVLGFGRTGRTLHLTLFKIELIKQIEDHCIKNGMQVVMTSDNCMTGTDRVVEVANQLDFDVFINVQGDEPIIEPADILSVIHECQSKPGIVVNAMAQIRTKEEFLSPNIPKVVATESGQLLYMSRAGIPGNKSLGFSGGMKQICIYGFPRKALEYFGESQTKTKLEWIEDIEILRFLELDIPVHMIEVTGGSFSVDTPADLEKVRQLLAEN